MRPTIGIALGTLLALSGCDVTIQGLGPSIVGSGVTKEETREVAAFTGIEVSAAIEATVTIGPEPSVKLSADDNILPLIRTEVKDGRLEVGYTPGQNIRTTKAQKVAIVVPSIKALAAHGAARITATGVEGTAIEVEAQGAASVLLEKMSADSVGVKAGGASKVTLDGQGKRLTLEVSGASTLTATRASFESAKVEFSGASRGEVTVSGSIEGEVSGASSLTVLGNPAGRSVRTSGASKVTY